MMILMTPEAVPDNTSLLDDLGEKVLTKTRQNRIEKKQN